MCPLWLTNCGMASDPLGAPGAGGVGMGWGGGRGCPRAGRVWLLRWGDAGRGLTGLKGGEAAPPLAPAASQNVG